MNDVEVRPRVFQPARAEGLARLEAERKLLKRYEAEYGRLVGRRGHVEAVRSLVKAHSRVYGEFVRDALVRHREMAERASRAA